AGQQLPDAPLGSGQAELTRGRLQVRVRLAVQGAGRVIARLRLGRLAAEALGVAEVLLDLGGGQLIAGRVGRGAEQSRLDAVRLLEVLRRLLRPAVEEVDLAQLEVSGGEAVLIRRVVGEGPGQLFPDGQRLPGILQGDLATGGGRGVHGGEVEADL